MTHASGKTLAVGSLDPGVAQSGACTFTFTVEDVKAGVGPYSVEVSHRGKIAFTRMRPRRSG